MVLVLVLLIGTKFDACAEHTRCGCYGRLRRLSRVAKLIVSDQSCTFPCERSLYWIVPM